MEPWTNPELFRDSDNLVGQRSLRNQICLLQLFELDAILLGYHNVIRIRFLNSGTRFGEILLKCRKPVRKFLILRSLDLQLGDMRRSCLLYKLLELRLLRASRSLRLLNMSLLLRDCTLKRLSIALALLERGLCDLLRLARLKNLHLHFLELLAQLLTLCSNRRSLSLRLSERNCVCLLQCGELGLDGGEIFAGLDQRGVLNCRCSRVLLRRFVGGLAERIEVLTRGLNFGFERLDACLQGADESSLCRGRSFGLRKL